MLADELFLRVLTEGNPPPTDTSTNTIALYGMISALGVALIAIFGQIVVAHYNQARAKNNTAADEDPSESDEGARIVKVPLRVSNEHEAWERFLLLNGIDPRRIKTGYENVEGVRR